MQPSRKGPSSLTRPFRIPEVNPVVYPTKGTFYAERWVEANLLSSRFDILGTLSKAIAEALVPKISDNSVILPQGNGLYLVRAVGPALVTPRTSSS